MDESSQEDEKIERLRRAMYSRSLSGNIKDRERRALSPDLPIVGDDWKVPEPGVKASVRAPRGLRFARRALTWIFVGVGVFFLGSVGFFVYYFTLGGGSLPASPGNIAISVVGPPQVAGGERTQLQVVVTNRNKVPLQLAELVLSFPPGTRRSDDLSTDLPTLRQPLGTIEPGGQRQGTISAVFAGNEGGRAMVRADVEYRLSNSSAIFVASSEYELVFSSSPLSVSIEGNSETISGQPIQLTFTVSSNANAPVKDVLLRLEYPFGFTFSSATPAPARRSTWELGDFAPAQKKTVVVRGVLSGESGDERVFRISAGTRKSAASSDIDAVLSENSYRMAISEAFLGLSIAVNKATGANTVVSPSENVNVVVSWQNNLSTAITDAVIVARLSGLQIDGAEVRSVDGFYRSGDSAVLWDKNTTSGVFTRIAPGAQGTVSFSFKMPSSETLQGVVNPYLNVTVNASGKRVSETGVPENLQSTAFQHVKLATDLEIAAQGLYYGNPFGSTGPLPPKAGTETTYAVVFTVTNTTNKIENASLTATLPPYIRWVGIYSPPSETISFNQSASTITWQIGTIEPGVGLGGVPPRQSAIAIGFTPSTSQIGQEPKLLEGIVLRGTDSATGGSITREEDDVTTNILGDPGFSAANATVVR
jgi:hypothetical protein